MKYRPKLTTAIICAATCVISVAATVFVMKNIDTGFDRLSRVEKIIEKSYIDEFDKNKAEDAAIKAIVDSLGDKYAVYYNEDEAEKVFDYIDGYYVGIGLEIFSNTQKNAIEVVSAYEGTPAFEAGLRKGDIIAEIDGSKYGSQDVGEASNYLRGAGMKNPENTKIVLTVLRDNKEFKVELKREKIELYRVEHSVDENGICYIKYNGFTQVNSQKVEDIINNLDAQKVRGIVFDVRNNPGGEFDSAISLCDLFIEDKIIMYTLDKNGEKKVYNSKKGACDLPLAVLVNGATASAAEIFAGCMQGNDRAVIVGEKTFGKGVSQSVQYINLLDLSDGALKLTTHKNYTPDGKWINESIMPDVEVKDDSENTAYKEAVNILLKKEQ